MIAAQEEAKVSYTIDDLRTVDEDDIDFDAEETVIN